MKIIMSIRDIEENKGFLQDMKQFFFNSAKMSILESYQDGTDFFLVLSNNQKKDELPKEARRVPLTFLVEAMTDEEIKRELKELKQMMSEINLLVES